MKCKYTGTKAKEYNYDFQSPIKRNLTLNQVKEIITQLELSSNVEFELCFNRVVPEDSVGYLYKDMESDTKYYWIHFRPA